jgi:hypothetical protein
VGSGAVAIALGDGAATIDGGASVWAKSAGDALGGGAGVATHPAISQARINSNERLLVQ